jgi:calcineurin-like phosphoesterase family protein
MAIKFTADRHIGHPAQARRRGYSPEKHGPAWLDVHNDHILDHIRSRMTVRDTLIIDGDVGFGRPEVLGPKIESIPGKKILVVGNHDSELVKRLSPLFAEVHLILNLKNPLGKAARGTPDPCRPPLVVICHYAFASWEKSHYGAWHLHGHSHGGMPPVPGRLDIGWDVHGKVLEWRDLLDLFTTAGSPHVPAAFRGPAAAPSAHEDDDDEEEA